MDAPADLPVGGAPAKAPAPRDPARVVKMYRKKARRLERDLYAELGRNVELYNRKNKAVSVLRRLTQEKQDLLDVLGKVLGGASVPSAPKVTLSPEQEELFHLENV